MKQRQTLRGSDDMTEKNKEQAGTDEDQDHENQERTHEPGEEFSSKQHRLAPFEVS